MSQHANHDRDPDAQLLRAQLRPWTAAIAGYLLWTFLRRPDEDRLLAVLGAWQPGRRDEP